MILIISESEQYRGKLDVAKIAHQLYQFDIEFLESLEKIIFLQEKGKFKKSDFLDKNGEGILLVPPINSPFETQHKKNFKKMAKVSSLFSKITIKDTYSYVYETGPKELANSAVAFYHPLLNYTLLDLMKSLPNSKCFINLAKCGSKYRNKIIQVEYVEEFIELVYVLKELSKKYIPGSDESVEFEKFQTPPGGILLNLIKNYCERDWRDINFYFIGDYEHYFKYIFEYLQAEVQNLLNLWDAISYSDCAEGFPEDIGSDSFFYAIYNTHCLSISAQSELINLLRSFLNWDRKFYFHANTDVMLPVFNGFLTRYKMPCVEDHSEIIELYFFSMLYRELWGTPKKIPLKVFTFKAFLPFLLKMKDISFVSRFVSNIDMTKVNVMSADFWYNFIIERNLYNDNSTQTPIVKQKSKRKEFYMHYRGDYWMISFGYDRPIIVENTDGLNYIAILLSAQHQRFFCEDIRKIVKPEIFPSEINEQTESWKIRNILLRKIELIKNKSSKITYPEITNIIESDFDLIKKDFKTFTKRKLDGILKDAIKMSKNDDPQGQVRAMRKAIAETIDRIERIETNLELNLPYSLSHYLKETFLPTSLPSDIRDRNERPSCFSDKTSTCKCEPPINHNIKWHIFIPFNLKELKSL